MCVRMCEPVWTSFFFRRSSCQQQQFTLQNEQTSSCEKSEKKMPRAQWNEQHQSIRVRRHNNNSNNNNKANANDVDSKKPSKKSRKTRKEWDFFFERVQKKKKTLRNRQALWSSSFGGVGTAAVKTLAKMIFIRSFFSGSVEICCFPMVCDDVPIYKW